MINLVAKPAEAKQVVAGIEKVATASTASTGKDTLPNTGEQSGLTLSLFGLGLGLAGLAVSARRRKVN